MDDDPGGLVTGQILGIVDGRDSATVSTWLAACTPACRDRVEVVAIDHSAAFRKALREYPPRAAVSVDKFHLVKLAHDTLTQVRQRLARDRHGRRGRRGRRGRKSDASWSHRPCCYAGQPPSPCAAGRACNGSSATMTHRRALRRLRHQGAGPPAAGHHYLADASHERMRLGHYVTVANMPETDLLYETITTW